METQYQTIRVLGHIHVIKPVSIENQTYMIRDPHTKILLCNSRVEEPNYKNTGMALCGILLDGESLGDWIVRTNKS